MYCLRCVPLTPGETMTEIKREKEKIEKGMGT